MKWLLARLSEPSTQAGIGVAAVVLNQIATSPTPTTTAEWAGLGAAVLAVLMKEKGTPHA